MLLGTLGGIFDGLRCGMEIIRRGNHWEHQRQHAQHGHQPEATAPAARTLEPPRWQGGERQQHPAKIEKILHFREPILTILDVDIVTEWVLPLGESGLS